MIVKLRGVLDAYGEEGVVVDVGGVGYWVSCSVKTLSRLPKVGEPVVLFTHMSVHENASRLIGFWDEEEREWFRLLTTVQGVGTKAGLAILSVLSPQELTQALFMQDKTAIVRAPGVGPKLAQRIVTELKDKTPSLSAITSCAPSLSGDAVSSAMQDAASALLNLGYAQPHITRALQLVMGAHGEGETGSLSSQSLIRHALKELAQPLLSERS